MYNKSASERKKGKIRNAFYYRAARFARKRANAVAPPLVVLSDCYFSDGENGNTNNEPAVEVQRNDRGNRLN